MLRKSRIALAVVFYLCITLLFLDFTGTLHAYLGWMAKIQFLPALLALNAIVIIFLIALTLLFGRVYCSIICPLGVFQDIVSWISGRRKKKNYRFSYSPEKKWLRYGILAMFVAAMIAGISSIVALLAPYSSYGRVASTFFAPLYGLTNNLLALIAEKADSYTFYETEVWFKSLSTFIVALITLIIIAVLAWRNGRTYCNTICPVGTVLGFFSRFSLFRPVIDTSKCNSCGLCNRKCKSSCINPKEHTIDYSRCVACMDCLATCKHGAISYSIRKPSAKKADNSTDANRRSFLSITALFATTTALEARKKKVDGGLAVIEDKKAPERATPIVPPGSIGLQHMANHCTACQLCIASCPNQVLRPSSRLGNFMQPEMSYERGYCRPECTKCSEVCPAGAILPISVADKSATQIGHAVWIKKNCIPLTSGNSCGNCARHCPTGAIEMIPSDPDNSDSPKIPAINTARCIGCGACENLCPARPFSAIYVEGIGVHNTL